MIKLNLYKELEKYGDIFAAAVYLCSESTVKADSDKEIAAMLKKVFEFKYSRSNIVIIDSYIDRADSRFQWERLLQDASSGRFQGVMHYRDLELAPDLKGLLLIDVSR